MKPTDTLTVLFRHHLWANLRLLEHCAQLTGEQLDTTIPGTFGSIRDTLQHIVRAEQSYLYRIRTGQPHPARTDESILTIPQMVDSVRKTGSGFIEWAPKVQADDTIQVTWKDGATRNVPKTIILTQALYHAVEHRAQIMTTLTQLGIEPPDLQAWQYFDESGELNASDNRN